MGRGGYPAAQESILCGSLVEIQRYVDGVLFIFDFGLGPRGFQVIEEAVSFDSRKKVIRVLYVERFAGLQTPHLTDHRFGNQIQSHDVELSLRELRLRRNLERQVDGVLA